MPILVGPPSGLRIIGVNVEGNHNLGHATRREWDSTEVELTQEIVVLCPCTLALEHLDQDAWLVLSVNGRACKLLPCALFGHFDDLVPDLGAEWARFFPTLCNWHVNDLLRCAVLRRLL